MFFGRSKVSSQPNRPVLLRPFVFKIRDGFLIGLAMDPKKGSPCAECVERWLQRRHVWVERAQPSDLKLRRDLLADLLSENSAHVFYEIDREGESTRIEGAVFPHPECICSRSNYIPPEIWTKKTNFAFSPIYRLRCSRFSTSEGNLWTAQAVGEGPNGQEITSGGVSQERDAARFAAVDRWLLGAALESAKTRASRGETLTGEILQTNAVTKIAPELGSDLAVSGMGAGDTRDAATLQALHGLARTRILRQYGNAMKSPMLIVGANNWLRGKVPFFLLQQYDLHPLFYPNSMPSWVVGIAAFSRQSTTEKPLFAFASGSLVGPALEMALGRILEQCQPPETRFSVEEEPEPEIKAKDVKKGVSGPSLSKLNLWWTHWIYRCPKISLRDVLHLEEHRNEISVWQEYFRDGLEPISIVSLNGELYPSGVRHLVAVTETKEARINRNVNGVGSFSASRDALI